MKCREILQQLEQDFPLSKAYEWDNVGLLAGRDDKVIEKIYIALDATDEAIDEAIAWGADMLLTHHPLIFSPLKKINNRNFIANRIIRLIQNDISYYAMHTNYDIVKMADLASDRLGLMDATPLEPSAWSAEEGLGKIGVLSPEDRMQSIEDYAAHVKQVFDLTEIKVFGDVNARISKVAILPGSGKSGIEAAIAQQADVLITGDIGHHEGMDASSRGLVIFDAGHYGIEHIFIQDMKQYLEKTPGKLEVKCAEKESPFYMI